MKQKIFTFSPIILFLLLLVDFYLIFVNAPEEKAQGLVQKIFYFHVSSAFMMYVGFGLGAIFAILFLWKRKPKWDAYSHAGVTIGLLFCTMVLISGPIWAKPVWGAWWSWDPRLTTTLLIWLIFFAYILLRQFYGNDPRGRVYAAVLTLFGVLDIPLIFFSVKLWRGIHPTVIGEEGNMPGEMKLALIFTNVVVLIFFALLFRIQSRVYLLEDKVEQIKSGQERN